MKNFYFLLRHCELDCESFNRRLFFMLFGGDNINYGYQNELDFVKLFNKKFLYELSSNSQYFLKELFEGGIDNEEKIVCWKNKMNQKADIFIKYKKVTKGVSLKSGNGNSVHCEQVQEFKRYLEKIKIPHLIIEKYISYHYGYMKDKNGNIDFSKKLSSYEYKEFYQDEIDIFNRYINKTRIIIDMIDRFLIRGRNSDYDIDALVSGTVDDYVWIMKYDLYDLILSKRYNDLTSPRIACMTIGPKKRNLNDNSSNSKDRYLVCIRWNCINDSIIEFKNKL